MAGVFGDPLKIGMDGMAKNGQRDRRLALEKRAAQLPFEADNGVGQGGLRDAAASRRPGEIVLLAERQEIADLPHLHGSPRRVGCACLGGCHRSRICMVRQFTQAPLSCWSPIRRERRGMHPKRAFEGFASFQGAAPLSIGKTRSARSIAISYSAPAAE